MKIGNKSIIGMYIFSPDALYESGDFVIYNKSIYICKVSKETLELSEYSLYNPDNPIYFSSYPDIGTATDNEIAQYLENPEDNEEIANKYISSLTLSKLLQGHFYYGIEDGKVKKIDKSDFDNINLNGDISEIIQEDIKVLSKIAENYDTSVFEVDYSIIQNEVSSLIQSYFSLDDTIYLFQIRFKNENKIIQQLINATTGFIAVREGADGIWKSSSYKNDVLEKIQQIDQYLTSKMNTITSINSGLQNTFCFSELNINNNTISNEDLDFINQSSIVNIILQKEENSIKRNFTVCIDLNECVSSNESIEYYISSEDTIECEYINEDESIRFILPNGIEIKNIYYRKYYG